MKQKLGIAFVILFECVMYITANYFMVSAALNYNVQPVKILVMMAGGYLMYQYRRSMKEILIHKWLADVLILLCFVITIVIVCFYGYMTMTLVPAPLY